jgi:hypothetical protein
MLQYIYSAYWIARFQNGFLLTATFELQLQADTASHVVTVISLGALNCCVRCTRARADTHTHKPYFILLTLRTFVLFYSLNISCVSFSECLIFVTGIHS